MHLYFRTDFRLIYLFWFDIFSFSRLLSFSLLLSNYIENSHHAFHHSKNQKKKFQAISSKYDLLSKYFVCFHLCVMKSFNNWTKKKTMLTRIDRYADILRAYSWKWNVFIQKKNFFLKYILFDAIFTFMFLCCYVFLIESKWLLENLFIKRKKERKRKPNDAGRKAFNKK